MPEEGESTSESKDVAEKQALSPAAEDTERTMENQTSTLATAESEYYKSHKPLLNYKILPIFDHSFCDPRPKRSWV